MYISRYCPFSNRILRDGAIVGAEVLVLPKYQQPEGKKENPRRGDSRIALKAGTS
jgi:hypothetical protein